MPESDPATDPAASGGMNFSFLDDPKSDEIEPNAEFKLNDDEVGPQATGAIESAAPTVPPPPLEFDDAAIHAADEAWSAEAVEAGAPPVTGEVAPSIEVSTETEVEADGVIAAAAAAATAATFTVPEIVEEPGPTPLDESSSEYDDYQSMVAHVRQTSLLGTIEAALGWDERCMMPAAGAEHRAEQMTLVSGLVHDRLTDPKLGDLLDRLADGEAAKNHDGEAFATIRQIRRQYEKRRKLPKSLVEELARTAVMGQHTWQEAREKNDFSLFAPLLEKMVGLKQQQAEALGYAEVPYDALLDEFEQGELTSRVTRVLGALRDELVPLVQSMMDGGRSPDVDIVHRRFPIDVQRAFGRFAADRIGFDFHRGRLDVTAHPFCTGLGPNDCRITTRYDENHFNSAFFGILHEAGHGIYDQGLRPDQYGLPLGEAVSMGIHESQSRMWEILVGRSLPFWKYMYPAARHAFPDALGGTSLGKFFFAINDVRPSLIRVEADEFFYNLHILIRFELEQALISGDLKVADLPTAWNEKYRDYLGVVVPNDADGVLQDIHWSAGLFGYFPTYTLGNLYASQLFEQADRELGGLDAQFERGEFQHLKRWLQVKIHRHGQRYTAAELCERITGRELSHEPLMAHLRRKYDLLYAPDAASIDDLDVATSGAIAAFAPTTDEAGIDVPVAADVGGFGFTGDSGVATAPSTGGVALRPRSIKRPKASMMGTVIVMVGIVLGGVLGIALGLWILMWWRGPQGDVLKIRDKLPAWIVPDWKEPEPEVPTDSEGLEPTTFRRLPQPRWAPSHPIST